MRALTLTNARPTLVDVPVPIPRPGEVLVEVLFSAVNGMDIEIQNGGWKPQVRCWRQTGPVVTGLEFSGIARSDGARIRSGQRVIGYSHVLHGPRTHAEFVSMPERDLQTLPAHLPDEDAAALIVGGLTALDILERLRPLRAGERCLVAGAAGGVGASTVQLAHAQGAEVTAVAAPTHAEWLRTLGAHHVRDGRDGRWWRDGDRFNLIVDAPGASRFADAVPHLAPRGTYVTSNPQRDMAGFVRATFSSRRSAWLLLLRSTSAGLEQLIHRASSGELRPVIDSIYPLDRAAGAFERAATRGKRGRVLLNIGARP
ncbi:NAD(P)-dependent alcohol dehydrogenase [Deinococcus hopiensis]|nr:NAD(P)-dependent alcohol dehydrogenase [Deinococcus hopiensis]